MPSFEVGTGTFQRTEAALGRRFSLDIAKATLTVFNCGSTEQYVRGVVARVTIGARTRLLSRLKLLELLYPRTTRHDIVREFNEF